MRDTIQHRFPQRRHHHGNDQKWLCDRLPHPENSTVQQPTPRQEEQKILHWMGQGNSGEAVHSLILMSDGVHHIIRELSKGKEMALLAVRPEIQGVMEHYGQGMMVSTQCAATSLSH